MSNRFRKNSTYDVSDRLSESSEYGISTANHESRRSFRNSAGTSSNMDVSPETELQTNRASHDIPFRHKAAAVSEDIPPIRPMRRKNSVRDDEVDFDSSEKQWNSAEHRPFRAGNRDCQSNPDSKETSASDVTKQFEEAMAKPRSDSRSTKPETASEQPVEQNSPAAQPGKSLGTAKPAAKTKEPPVNIAAIKERILEKVPIIKHNGGIYAYNGRTYVAITDAAQIVGIVINQVDDKLFGLSSTNIFSGVLTALQHDDKLTPADYTERVIASEYIVVFKNTLLDVRSLKKIPFNPWYITSFEIDANYVNHPEPDVYLDFLRTVSGGDMDIEARITDSISYILSGSNQGKFFIVYGPAPDSGKSTLATVVQELIHEKYVFNVAPNEFKDRFSLGGSRGRILNLSMDLPSTVLHSDVVAIIKRITGGDKIMSQDKNEKKEFGISSMRLLFGTNNPVSVHPSDDNDSFWDRLQIVPFIHSVAADAKDPHLVQKLLAERDDIVSYCIQKMPEIIDRGYKLSPCQAAEDIKNEWRYGVPESESLESFCDTFVEITGSKEDIILTTDIYKPYKMFCSDIGVKPLREENIKKWFSDHGVDCDRQRLSGAKNAQAVFIGVRLLE